jgi:hypothetical protein
MPGASRTHATTPRLRHHEIGLSSISHAVVCESRLIADHRDGMASERRPTKMSPVTMVMPGSSEAPVEGKGPASILAFFPSPIG